jgi:Sulfotransferase family
MTHRDPTEVMVSVADVYAEVGRQFSDDLDLHYLGRLNVRHWTTGMERLLRFRAEHGDDRFYDIDFRAVQRDPIGQVRALYAWLGEPVSEAFEQGMRRWWKEHAETRDPNIHPDPGQFGLDLDHVRGLFAEYSAKIAQWTAATTAASRGV